jgi:hypothetical protein
MLLSSQCPGVEEQQLIRRYLNAIELQPGAGQGRFDLFNRFNSLPRVRGKPRKTS